MIDLSGIFGERGGTRTLDPMIKSYVLGAPPQYRSIYRSHSPHSSANLHLGPSFAGRAAVPTDSGQGEIADQPCSHQRLVTAYLAGGAGVIASASCGRGAKSRFQCHRRKVPENNFRRPTFAAKNVTDLIRLPKSSSKSMHLSNSDPWAFRKNFE